MASRGIYKGRPCSADSVKKRIDFQGIGICVDRPRGFKMKGTDDKGNPWERTYKVDYGFIPKTLGGDGDGIDVFLGPQKNAPNAFWAVQNKADGVFDEYKVFLGFPNRNAALSCYEEHIPKKLLSGLTTMRVDMMRSMLGVDPKGLAKVASFCVELDKLAFGDDILGEGGAAMMQQARSAFEEGRTALKPYTRREAVDRLRRRLQEEMQTVKGRLGK